MEREIKFALPDSTTLNRLLSITELGGLSIGPPSSVVDHDRYLDTVDLELFHSGYSCRVRNRSNGRHVLTIKSIQPPEGMLHRRMELEFEIPSYVVIERVNTWPSTPARELVLTIVKDKPLRLLFEFNQTRHLRAAWTESPEKPQVEISLDEVRLGPPSTVIFGVEAELLHDGDPALLDELATIFSREWQLTPESRAKFMIAVALLRPESLPST